MGKVVKKGVVKKGRKVEEVENKLKIKEIKRKIKIKEDFGSEKNVQKEDLKEEINNKRFNEFLLHSSARPNPALERVESAQDQSSLEQELADVQAQNVQAKENSSIDYKEARPDYLSTADAGGQRGENQHEGVLSEAPDYSIIDREDDGTRNLIGQGDAPQTRRNEFEMEKQAFVQRDKETRKYISKGDMK